MNADISNGKLLWVNDERNKGKKHERRKLRQYTAAYWYEIEVMVGKVVNSVLLYGKCIWFYGFVAMRDLHFLYAWVCGACFLWLLSLLLLFIIWEWSEPVLEGAR